MREVGGEGRALTASKVGSGGDGEGVGEEGRGGIGGGGGGEVREEVKETHAEDDGGEGGGGRMREVKVCCEVRVRKYGERKSWCNMEVQEKK